MKLLFVLLSVCSLLVDQGASIADSVEVSVKEGDSVTLHTDAKKTKQDRIKWYYNDILIAQINTDPSKTCTDVQCNNDTERFRDRLKLDHQTGSLTIMNTRNTDSGEYNLLITNNNNDSETIYSVSVKGVSAAERDEVKRKTVKEGESVSLDSDVKRNPNDVMTWYYNNTLIAEITGDQSKICSDVQCKERFRDRLKLDHQTGSLTITDTRNTDSGLYELKINRISRRRRRSVSSVKSFEVTVIGSGLSGSGLSGSGLSSGAVAGIVVVLLVSVLTAAGVGVIHYRYRSTSKVMFFKAAVEEEKPNASVESPIKEMEKGRGHVI